MVGSERPCHSNCSTTPVILFAEFTNPRSDACHEAGLTDHIWCVEVDRIVREQDAGGSSLRLILAMNILALICWVAAIPWGIQSNRSKLVSQVLRIAGTVLMLAVSLRWFLFLRSH